MALPYPRQLLDFHTFIGGKTGSAKSSKARLGVEDMLHRRLPVNILDPKGDWWGLKSSADGKGPGYPIVIFGGVHADVPITPRSGGEVAKMIFTGNFPSLIDMKGWMPSERSQFVIDYLAQIFKDSYGERPMVVDECHNFAPKGRVLSPQAGEMLHWMNRLASEGRGLGLNVTFVSQRPQKVHNDLLTSCETLIACKVIHKADRDAMKDWIDGCADRDIGNQVLNELASLKKPEAWVWCPEIEFGPKKVTFPMFETYDSFAPQSTSKRRLKGWAEVDIDRMRNQLQTVVAEAEANDPTTLKKTIKDLRDQLARSIGHKQKSSDTNEVRDLRKQLTAEQNRCKDLETHAKALYEALQDAYDAGVQIIKIAGPIKNPATVKKPKTFLAKYRFTPPDSLLEKPAATTKIQNHIKTPSPDGLSKMSSKILQVLAQFPAGGCELGKLTLLTGYRKSGGFLNSLSALRTAGYIDGPNTGVMKITHEGMQQGPFEPLPEGEELVEYWVNHSSFNKMARAILAVLRDGTERTLEELTEATGYAKSGGFLNSLSMLRTAGVLVGKNTGNMRISPLIVPE